MSLGVIVAVGAEPTVIVSGDEVTKHPEDVSVTVTKYVPEAETVIDCVVSPPSDHKYESAGSAVRITESPWQNVTDPLGVIDAVGAELTVTVSGDEVALHPKEVSVTVTK